MKNNANNLTTSEISEIIKNKKKFFENVTTEANNFVTHK